MLAVQLYGVVALGLVCVPFPNFGHVLTFMNPPLLALGLLFVYALSVAVLAGVGLKQLCSGARRGGELCPARQLDAPSDQQGLERERRRGRICGVHQFELPAVGLLPDPLGALIPNSDFTEMEHT